MKATIHLSSKEVQELIVNHFANLGIKVGSPIEFVIREEGHRDPYMVFSHASVIVDIPADLMAKKPEKVWLKSES